MAKTAADTLIETLQDWGVEVVFGLPGDGINGIMERRLPLSLAAGEALLPPAGHARSDRKERRP